MNAYFWVFPVAVTHCQVMDSSQRKIKWLAFLSLSGTDTFRDES